VTLAAETVGRQSVVVVLNVKETSAGVYETFVQGADKATGLHPVAFAKQMEELGAGEIVVNSIDRDGTMQGYDMALVTQFKGVLSVPLTFLGGAGSLADIANLIQIFGTVGAAAGSMFVFKGKYRAVLLSYPDQQQKEELFARSSVQHRSMCS
jgi:cyclase